ncbi:acyl carrier protein [Xylanibacter brevis]|uniref:acyl carrier protein n=1 Tax=Xylanibacter brevis TaxID=83231 RepID=UPI0004817ED4|nr:acyl carrier protein [Xylanibacter brevis]
MELKDFIEKFREQFDETEPEEINADTYFKELDEWGSLKGLLVMAMVSDEYGKQIKAEDIRKADTVEDLFNIVNAL